jgi:2-hydroxychromene-2-carboxylate isomerase
VIRFCFDYLSPYAYLAWTQIGAVAARHDRQVEPVPVLFAGLLGAAGTKGPAEVPAKRRYLVSDCLRSAHRLGVPLAPPPTHPFLPLLALRVTSVDMTSGERTRLVDALFAAAWGGGAGGVHGVEDARSVAAIASGIGLDGAALVAAAATPEVKDRLRRQTDDAIAAGAFGVPTMFDGAEMFWGLDSLPNLEQHLRGEDPTALAERERWSTLTASAQRRT